ncbi:hypothetical protein EHV15_04650 [Paenibacillus oralis]|uniref:Uncharacterized protein n=1 Tax=Paenibacillus oralis TaxID=2490856 RepID=A0A3P3UAP1_9BACL|nr:hypothetical protein [Paenibacillus oralis]RRJ67400.1 hypothetical protein EHV15_04650 [Paenibacillus oralis]
MKTGWKIAAAVALIGGSVGAGSLLNLRAEGAGTTPGTADDPVVTKSYVDQAIQQALNGGGSGKGSGNSNSSSTGKDGNSSSSSSSSSKGEASKGATDGIEIVEVKPGKILYGYAGAEFVVRSGKAVVYSADASGVADLTDGIDIGNGGTVEKNHLLSFPREGRGIQVQAGDTHNLTVMVRGGYELK